MNIPKKPFFTLSAGALAEWLEGQPEKWWSVDGDPVLMSVVDFPCPSDELAPVIRRVGTDLLLRDKNPASQAKGERIAEGELDRLADTANSNHRKILALSWADSEVDWLLLEDEAMVAS